MNVRIENFEDKSEKDNSGFYEYFYSGKIFFFDDLGTRVSVRTYDDLPDEAHFVSINDQVFDADTVHHPLLNQIETYFRETGIKHFKILDGNKVGSVNFLVEDGATFIERIEFWHNRAADTKFVWFPFYFLKPRSDRKMDWSLKAKMTFCFGLYYGFFSGLRSWIFSDSDFFGVSVKDIGLSILIFAFWFQVVTAPLWNRRARRLTQQKSFK